MKRSWLIRAFMSFVSGRPRLFVDRFASTADEPSTDQPSAPPQEETSVGGTDHGLRVSQSGALTTPYGRLVEVDWREAHIGAAEAIQSLLVDNQDSYYMHPNKRMAFILTRRAGLTRVVDHFERYTEEQVTAYLTYVRERLE